MFKRLGAVCLTAFFVVGITAAEAAEMRPNCSKKLLRSANHHRAIVVHRHGNDAAGRDIVRWGRIGPNQRAHAVRDCDVIRRYRDQLVQLHTVPRYPTLKRTAVQPYRAPAGVKTPSVGAGPVLERIAQCESGGNPATNTGNGFYGKYQFTDQTWHAMGGTGHASDAPEAEQDMRAAALYGDGSGAGNWPVCSR